MKLTNEMKRILKAELVVKIEDKNRAAIEALSKKILETYQEHLLPLSVIEKHKLKPHLQKADIVRLLGTYVRDYEIYGNHHYETLNVYKNIMRSKTLPKALKDLVKELQILKTEDAKLIKEANAVFDGVSTDKALFEAWPEIEVFFRERFNISASNGKGMAIYVHPSDTLRQVVVSS